MSRIGENHPDNVFSARGRVNGQSDGQLRSRGLDSQGHPAPAEKTSKSAGQQPSRPGGSRGQSIAQLAQSIGSLELSNQDDLYAFCEAVRAIQNYLGMSIQMAEGQLKAAAREQAKEAKDGWMTPAQRAKLALTLKMVGRDLRQSAEGCTEAAAGAVKAWRRFQALLGDFENERKGVSRPGSRRSGFTVV